MVGRNTRRITKSILILLFLFSMGYLLAAGIDSDDVDELCDDDLSIIMRVNGSWQCVNMTATYIPYYNATGNANMSYWNFSAAYICDNQGNCLHKINTSVSNSSVVNDTKWDLNKSWLFNSTGLLTINTTYLFNNIRDVSRTYGQSFFVEKWGDNLRGNYSFNELSYFNNATTILKPKNSHCGTIQYFDEDGVLTFKWSGKKCT